MTVLVPFAPPPSPVTMPEPWAEPGRVAMVEQLLAARDSDRGTRHHRHEIVTKHLEHL
jgi:hypothetical protein